MQLLPPLSDEEYRALKEDIVQRGIQVPVEVDENGDVLDGNSRVRAWEELRAEGIKLPDYPRIVRSGMTEAEKRNHARALNIIRRHLTNEQMVPILADMRADGMTYQAIADKSGVGLMTVHRAVLSNDKTQPAAVTGKDGKQYPPKKRRKQASVFASDKKGEKRAIKAVTMIDDAPDKVLPLRRAERIAREQDIEHRRQNMDSALELKSLPQAIDIRLGDFREVLSDLTPNTVDLICTDPPYSKDFLPLWVDLAAFASLVLKPGGWLVTYSGQTYLAEVIKALTSHLQYVWTIAQVNSSGAKTIIHHAKVYSRWKPILLFTKPPLTPIDWFNDLIEGGGREKDLHDWQQAEQEVTYCLERFSREGQLVVDPFLGSGTMAIAAHRLGRRFIGVDTDAMAVSKTLERLNEQNRA